MPDLSAPLSLHALDASPSVLLKTSGGSVTSFAFPAGDGLKEHATPHDALVVGVEGEIQVSLAGAEHTLQAGNAIHFPARAPHSVKALTDARMLLILLKHDA